MMLTWKTFGLLRINKRRCVDRAIALGAPWPEAQWIESTAREYAPNQLLCVFPDRDSGQILGCG